MRKANSNIINIIQNGMPLSIETALMLRTKLESEGFIVSKDISEDALVNICIGGDGAFLRSVHASKFSSIPFIGVNTGHLGFFQEIAPNNLDMLVSSLANKTYSIEEIDLVEATIHTKEEDFKLKAINEIVIKGYSSKVVHLDIFIDNDIFENVSGDGIIVSTPIGSTGYNFSCSGSIVSPILKTMQVTPIAPINSKAYRCMVNSLIIPHSSSVIIRPENRDENRIVVIADGFQHKYPLIQDIEFGFSSHKLKKLVVNKKSFWNNVREKFL